jgi:HEAT repeat protein
VIGSVSIDALVLAKDTAAVAAAREGGPGAVAPLVPLAHHEDVDVRALAVDALGAIVASNADGAALDALVAALGDPAGAVRGSALDALAGARDPGSARVLGALAAAEDQGARLRLARVLARATDVDVPTLERLSEQEREPRVRELLAAACARRGDARALRALADRLLATRGLARVEALSDAALAASSALLPAVRKLLDDEDDAVYVGGAPGRPDTLRVCDLALVVAVGIARLPFEIRPEELYTAQEIAAVRVALPEGPLLPPLGR